MARRYLVVSGWLIAAAAAACGDPVETAVKVPTGRVIGRIEIAAEIPAPKCRVLVEGIPLGDRCDSAGQFDISQIPSGRRDLRIITDPDRKGPLVTARRIAAAVNAGFLTDLGAIRVAPAGAIGGRVKAKDGKIPFAIIAVPLYGAVTAPMDNGAYLLKNVPPGTHDVVLTVEGKDMKVTGVEVKSQLTTTKVDFDLGLAKAHVVQLLGRAARQGKAESEHGDLKVELIEVVDGKVIQSGKTLDDGRFDIKAKSGIYQLRVSDGTSPITATVPFIVLHGDGPIVIDYTIVVPPENGDLDGDSVPNDKDLDIDGDGVPNDKDAFKYDPAESVDTDGDGVGDGADLRSKGGSSIDDRVLVKDTDNDGLYDFEDNCPSKDNKAQTDTDGDGVGNDCDNCPYVANKDQKDSVGDNTGDACRSCIVGEACSPKNPCNQGKLACPKTGAVCGDVGVPVKNGTSCGTDQVCNNGVCGPCKAGETCTPPTKPCNRGTYSCTTGTGFCKDIGIFAADGTVCGTNLVCSSGKCVTCLSGGSCLPATLCREGKLDCSSGKPSCLASSTYATDGTSCGTKLVCKGGSCVACNEGGSCTPPTKPCNKGTFSCSSGLEVCVDSGTSAPDGTACGSGVYCKAGACTTLPDKLTIVSGDSQSGTIGATLKPVVLKLVDGGGKAKAGEKVSFSAPTGGAVTPASALTSGAGQVTVTPRLGLTLGAQTFSAQAASAPPAQIKASATAAPAGKSFTMVNADQTKGDSGVPGPATSARTGQPYAMAVSKAGAVYFADYDGHRVRVVLPDGTINNVAGTGVYGFSGDYGPATSAKLYFPLAVALDEAKQRLYIADSYNKRVRVVDLSLATPTIQTYAGGGSAPAPGYGDGGLAKAAELKDPARLTIGPGGALYIGDKGHGRIRRVDPTTGVISTFIKPTSCDSTTTVVIKSCVNVSCGVIWDSKGNAFITAGLCGSATGSTSGTTPGIVRRDTSGTLHHVAGKYSGVTTDGADARLSSVTPGRMALDSAGNLLFAEPTKHRIRRIDSRTRLLSTVAGTGSPGKATEFSPAATSPLNDPRALAFVGKDLLIADSYNYSIRRLPAADITTPTAVTLALKSGDKQALKPAQLTPLPLAVKLTAAGSTLASVLVFWSGGEAAVGLTASEAISAADGVALVSARPGITAGSFAVNATFSDIHGAPVSGSPVKLTLPATAPTAKTIFTAVNVSGQSGGSGAPGPATLAQLITPAGLATASDGTIYVSSTHQVRKITKRGALSVVAGGSANGLYGDNGPADKALLFYPSGLALDETRKRLYIADKLNNRVRMIDLASGIITTYAGGGSAGPPTYGDGSPATQASLSSPGYLALGTGGVLFIGDTGTSRVRKVDPVTKLITKVVGPDSCAGSPTAGLYSCGSGGGGCGLAADASGGVYVSAYICGSKANAAPYTPGIIHVSSSGTVTHVAGRAGGSSADGTAAASYTFSAVGGLARTGTTLYVGQGHRVMKLSTSGGTVVTLAGKTASGYSGDYGPAAAALLKTPAGLAVTPDGHLVIADGGNNSVRIVW